MRKKNLIITLFLAITVLVTASCNSAGTNSTGADSTDAETNMDSAAGGTVAGVVNAHADIANTKADTTGSGTADFTQKEDGTVEMKLDITFPAKANQSVAVHLHEHGDCSDSGKGAHGHWNPTNEPHGKWESEAYHSGDIGNVELDENGKGSVTLASDRWSIGGDEKTNILNRAIIVHSGVDDYKTQPTGNAGSRIGCGVILAK